MIKYEQFANKSDSVVRGVEKIIAQGKTPFQEYMFFKSKENDVCIAIDGDIQSCKKDEAIYHEALTHPALLLHPNPKNVLIMGGGEGATAREVLRYSEVLERIVMVDIDKEFVQVCKKYAPTWSDGCFSNEKLEVLYMDIKEYLASSNVKFDVVIGDLVDVDNWDGFLATLYNENFYKNLKKTLSPNAVVATQGGALDTLPNQNHKNIRKSLASVFSHVKSYAVVVPSFYSLWGYVVASDARFNLNEFELRLKQRKIELKAIGNENLSALFALPRMIRESFVD